MPQLIITVDTELSNFPDAQGLWGKTARGAELGLAFMVEAFDDLGIQATFFSDVYGRTDTDIAAQRRACELVAEHDQDLQLHTHPGSTFDTERPQLKHYSRDDQREILRFGRKRIREWTGKNTRLHRAGDWAANKDSLEALTECGFEADFSACAWSRHCELPERLCNGNGWSRFNDLLCCPVTCYRDRISGRLRRVDLFTNSLAELHDILAKQVDPIVLTLHSFSFYLEWQRGNRQRAIMRRLARFTELACRQGYETISAAQAVDRATPHKDQPLVPFPRSSFGASLRGIIRSCQRRLMQRRRSLE